MVVNEEAVKDMKGVKKVRVAAMSSCGGLAAKKTINIFGDRNEWSWRVAVKSGHNEQL